MRDIERIQKEKEVSGVCGLFCPSCSLYIGTKEEPQRLEMLAEKFRRPVSDMLCSGCRSDTVSFYCKECFFKQCAKERGIEFCAYCSEYPCDRLAEFQKQAPHRAELWESQAVIKNEGFEQWYENRKTRHSCLSCGEINSAYESNCRKCGKSPSSRFFESNRDIIMKFIDAQKQK